MFRLDIRVQLDDDDPLAVALRQTPLRQRGRMYMAWARLGLAAHVLDNGEDVAQAWARLADRLDQVEEQLRRISLADGVVSPRPAASPPADADTIAADHQNLIDNMMAAFNIVRTITEDDDSEASG